MRNLLGTAKQPQWWKLIKLALERWAETDGDQRAAALAYYLLLSALPMVIMLVNVGSLFVEREVATRAVVRLANRYTPLTAEQARAAGTAVRGMLAARGAISLTAFVLLLVGALQYLGTLIRTTNRIWHSQAYNWWRLPLLSLGLLGITASAIVVGILLPGLATLAHPWLTTYLAFPNWAFALGFKLIPWVVLFYGVIMIYRLAPTRATRFAEVWLGALVATVVIWIAELLFLVYAVKVAQFNLLYGTLGGIMAFLAWIYISSCVGVFGICLCVAQAEVRQVNRQVELPTP